MNKTYNAPTIVTIFGATGDLSKRKLLPSLFDLFERGLLPDSFRVVGFARSPLGDEEFRSFAREAVLSRGHDIDMDKIQEFVEMLTYQAGDITVEESYGELSDTLISIEDSFGQCTNKAFYLAISPHFYDTAFRYLADSGLTIPCSNDTGWTRILVEKPFGNDVETAQELDKTLGLLFKEEQIFRIDHYLGKGALQDILMFRFSNSIFEPIWNNGYIEKVEIKLAETLDIEGRGAFYDEIGALRDVGQNHILQMLALIAMKNPGSLDANKIRSERARVLNNIRRIDAGNVTESIARGQYDGYMQEKNVDPASKTETYFKIKTYIDDDVWRGVPFYLESGKALDKKETSITIHFKNNDACLCSKTCEVHHQNILTFRIQPDEGISVRFWAKESGFSKKLEPKDLSFAYKKEGERLPDAYEHILFDAISGEQTLFTSTEEVSAAWKFIMPIIEHWHHCPLVQYKKGGRGPEVAL
jgi:glucose-6-phosphate 1-dehydrogenase